MLPLLALLGGLSRAADPDAADLAEAAAVAEALGRVQNAWTGHTLRSGVPACAHGEARTLVTRSRLLGAELHRRLVPLVADHAEDPRVDALVGQYLAGVAFQARVIEVHGGDCAAPLAPSPGVGPQPEADRPVAILALMGVICPGLEPGDGGVMVVDGPVCATPFGSCDCSPRPVLPGEVVGP